MPVAQMLRTITSEEVTEWLAYFHIEAQEAKAVADKNKQMGGR